jgi:hypothetical protein
MNKGSRDEALFTMRNSYFGLIGVALLVVRGQKTTKKEACVQENKSNLDLQIRNVEKWVHNFSLPPSPQAGERARRHQLTDFYCHWSASSSHV